MHKTYVTPGLRIRPVDYENAILGSRLGGGDDMDKEFFDPWADES